jgi:hypothetical protein
MIELENWATGQLKYWVDLDDPRFGRCLWLRDKNGDTTLVKEIPARFKKYFK